ncbi:MAG: sigma-70 family RNA polymerase sigma factor [Deltaproteobacteria bacterium]|nr:sigma-70 family RNA polymerase sigma factor [Deltaproteobacteria bacterium]MBK8715348.1 sigma-70 family RNA polymerase sigma factor [Deltaproteobacteria bacterium]MBP7291547.1 sigma-70 family RNA polymerase sigma factor [Nannocystaceae bacterium]
MSLDVEDLYRRFGPMVLRRCRTLLGDPETAHDAMHDVFVEICRRHETLVDAGLSSLLYRTATNVCLNRMRSTRRRPSEPASDMLARIADLDRTDERQAARSLLDRVLGREPESSATIAVLHLVDGHTLEETAEIVGMSVSGVRKRLRKLQSSLQAAQGQA